MSLLRLAILATLSLAPAAAFAADEKDGKTSKWDINAAHGPTKTVKFTTDEGTWIDLDVSPDGRSIVFALLGDLYLLPIEGGSAKRLTSGPAWDVQPRKSPDGS
jgi:Tol biopolymer transport system component